MNTMPSILAVFGLGGPELIVILVILLVLFGGAKLPELAKGLGKSIKEFKRASQETDDHGVPTPERASPPVQAQPPPPATTPTTPAAH